MATDGEIPAQTKQGRRLMRALLPDAPNANGWPYRLMVAVDGYYCSYRAVHEAGLITHAISISREVDIIIGSKSC